MEYIPTMSLQKYLYYYTYTRKSETHSYNHLYEGIFTVKSIHVKPGLTKSWILSHSLLQPYMKYFYKIITSYMIDYNHSSNTDNIRRQVTGYIMSMKRKQGMKLKTYTPEESKYHLMFNNMLPSDSDLLQTNTHKGCYVMNANEYNYKPRSMIGQEDESKVKKWIWFNTQVHDTLLFSWMISRKLVDHTNFGRAIGRLIDLIYAPSA